MKPAFTFETFWWGNGQTPKGKTIPRWWINFCNEYDDTNKWHPAITKYANYRLKSNGTIRVVFHGPEELSFFILRYS